MMYSWRLACAFAVLMHTGGLALAVKAQECPVNHAPATDGEKALAREDVVRALKFYREGTAKEPGDLPSNLGLVRALILHDDTPEAIETANAMLAKNPHSALAEVAAGEAAFRAADFDSAMRHAQAAVRDDNCEAQAMMLMARVYRSTAHLASATNLIGVAHHLMPNDEIGHRAWIDSLPRKERLEELEKYLAGATELSAEDRELYENSLAYTKSIHPGECRISSKTETVQIPFSPVYASDDTIGAYGLDVDLNGKKRTLAVDTGASGITLSPSAAKHLGLTPELALKTMGVGNEGASESYLTHVASIQIGDVQISDCTVTVLQQKSRVDVDGVIGMDVFDRWIATLDFPKQKLTLSPLPLAAGFNSSGGAEAEEARRPVDAITPPGMESWLHVTRVGHDLLLPTSANGGPVHFTIIDPGTSESAFALPFAKQMGELRKSPMSFEGLPETVKNIYAVKKVKLEIGQLKVPPAQYYAFDFTNLSHAEGTEVSGFIGLHTLVRMTISIDYRDNLVLLQ